MNGCNPANSEARFEHVVGCVPLLRMWSLVVVRFFVVVIGTTLSSLGG